MGDRFASSREESVMDHMPQRRSPEPVGEWEDIVLVPFAASEKLPQPHDPPRVKRGFRP